LLFPPPLLRVLYLRHLTPIFFFFRTQACPLRLVPPSSPGAHVAMNNRGAVFPPFFFSSSKKHSSVRVDLSPDADWFPSFFSIPLKPDLSERPSKRSLFPPLFQYVKRESGLLEGTWPDAPFPPRGEINAYIDRLLFLLFFL